MGLGDHRPSDAETQTAMDLRGRLRKSTHLFQSFWLQHLLTVRNADIGPFDMIIRKPLNHDTMRAAIASFMANRH